MLFGQGEEKSFHWLLIILFGCLCKHRFVSIEETSDDEFYHRWSLFYWAIF